MKIVFLALLVSFSAFAEDQPANTTVEPAQYKNLTIDRAEINADLEHLNELIANSQAVPEMQNGKVVGYRKRDTSLGERRLKKMRIKQDTLITAPNSNN